MELVSSTFHILDDKMKILYLSIIIILILCNSGVVCAQYGQEDSNPSHHNILQEQFDLDRTQIEISQQEEEQVKNIKRWYHSGRGGSTNICWSFNRCFIIC